MTQVIVQKLSDSDSAKAGVLQYADHIMDALLNVFACRKSSVHEEAMLAVVSWSGGDVGWRRRKGKAWRRACPSSDIGYAWSRTRWWQLVASPGTESGCF